MNCCCGNDPFELVPFDETVDTRSCCKCYNRYYYEDFHICPGVRCTVDTCLQTLEGSDASSSSCLCTSDNAPPCSMCSIVCCPISFVLDIISCPFRYCDRKSSDKKLEQSNSNNNTENETIDWQPVNYNRNYGTEPVLSSQPVPVHFD
jgi:hypothetical protein